MAQTAERATTPPPETQIEYTKKARHGHGQDVVNEDNIRQVAGCLPIDPVNKRFLLVSSRKKEGAWVMPKGGWEQDETQEQAALRETWEEAGIKGRITRHIGVFEERNKKGLKAHHWIYELEISEVAKKFPEKKKRERRWFTYEEALVATKSAYLHDALRMSSLNPAALAHSKQQSNNQPPSQQEQKTQQAVPPPPQQQQQQQQQQPPPPPPPPQQQQQQQILPPSPPPQQPNSNRKSIGSQLKSLFGKK